MPDPPCDDNKNLFHGFTRNDDERDYQWNGIVLFAAAVSIFIVFIITMIVYYVYFRLYSNRLQRAMRRRPRRRSIISQGHRFSLRAVRDYYSNIASPAEQGLSDATVKALPVFVYKAEDLGDALRCAVCLCEFEENEKGRVLPNCGHRFHADCIDMWFYSHSTCPLCRQDVGPQPENGHVVVEVSNGREENGDGNEKIGDGDASASAELEEENGHRTKDVEGENRVDIAVSTLPMER